MVVTNDSTVGGFRYSYYDNKPVVSQPKPRDSPKPTVRIPPSNLPETPPPGYTSQDGSLHHSNPRMPLPSPGTQAEFQSEVVVHTPEQKKGSVSPRDVTVYANVPIKQESSPYENVKRRLPVEDEAPPIPPRQPTITHRSVSPNRRPLPAQVVPSSRPDTPFSEVDENDVEGMFDRVIQVAKDEEERRESLKSNYEETPANTLGTPAHYSGQDARKSLPVQEYIQMNDRTPPRKSLEENIDSPRSSGAYRSFQAPRAVVQPQVQRVRSDRVRSNVQSEASTASAIQTMEDVPADVEKLSVEDVCQCLRLLNMDAHIPEFRSHQIDGKLLAGMNEKVLINDFRLTDFNASKILRFTRGWRPKLA